MKHETLMDALALKAEVAISIYAPTHRTAPANLADRIVVKNLVTEAESRIAELGPKRDYEDLLSNLERAFDSIDWNTSLDGIGLLISSAGFSKYDLEHSPAPRVSVSSSFQIAELARAASQSWQYQLLVLSESPTRMFTADRTQLTEVTEGFPIFHMGRGGVEGKPTGFGKQTSVILDEVHRQFFREISDAVTAAQRANGGPLPLVVTGVDRFLAFWDDVAPEHKPAVAIAGSYDFKTEAELVSKLWPAIDEHFAELNNQIVENLEIARSNRTYAGGHAEVLDKAEAGRIRVLVVADSETTNAETELAVRRTLETGGEVNFVTAERLADFAPIAADLRF